MSKLNIDQKTIAGLFADKKSDFLIPDYQRPYAWEDTECQTLWEDIFTFAFPDNDCTKFDSDSDEYFLGPIVTFKNDNNKMEVIDGQQRLTTLMLLLRAFYEKFGNMQDENSKKTRENLEKCIWKTDEFGTPDKSKLKIDSEVATDNDKDEFLNILKSGAAPATMMIMKKPTKFPFASEKSLLKIHSASLLICCFQFINVCLLAFSIRLKQEVLETTIFQKKNGFWMVNQFFMPMLI